jgi:gliding motility-associated-like protein
LWTFGDLTTTSDTSTVFEPTYVYPDTGTYNVQLIVNPGISCADTGRCLVNIYPYLTPDFSVIESCVNFPYVFNNESTTTYGVISDCQWDFGDGSTGSGLSATHIYTSVGDYTATLIVTNTFGCVDSITQIVNVDVTSSVQLTPDTVFCQFDGIELQAGGGVIYNWLPPTFLSNPSIANPLCTATTVTTYTVEITNAFGCFNTATVTVTPITTVSVVMDSALTDCVGDTVQLKGNVSSILQGSLSYDWSPNTLDSNNPSNCIVPSNTTTYTLTASLGTCFGTDTQTINAIPLPIISISPNQRICENDSTVLVATGGSSYLWSPPATIDRPTFGATMVYPDTTTIYNCNVSVLGVCARTVSLSTQVEVIPYNVKLGSDQVIYLGENIAFSTDSSYSYYWYPPELFSVPTIPNPTYKPTQSGFVVFTGVSLEGCVAIDSMYVKVIDPSIEAPNAFSPNGDGINDVFMLYSKDYKYNSFNIYDRWGEKVFSTNDTKQGWDGTWKGKNASSGVYVYYATYYNELETEQVIKGNVTLIR